MGYLRVPSGYPYAKGISDYFKAYNALFSADNIRDVLQVAKFINPCWLDSKYGDYFLNIANTTPLLFRKVMGIKEIGIRMFVHKLATGLFRDESILHGHSGSLDRDIILRTLQVIADPLIIFRIKWDRESAFLAYYDVPDKKGVPIFCAFRKTRTNPSSLLIATMFGRPPSSYMGMPHLAVRYFDDIRFENARSPQTEALRPFLDYLLREKDFVWTKRRILEQMCSLRITN